MKSKAKAAPSTALTFLLAGLDFPDSQDPSGFGREDVAVQLRAIAGSRKEFDALWSYLHSPDYSRAGLATRLRALGGLS